MPGPEATIPPRVHVIPGLDIEALADLWASRGLACESNFGSFPGTEGGYNVSCERTDESADTTYVGEAVYWTMESVQALKLRINPISVDGTLDTSAAANILMPTAELVGGPAARAWVQERIGDMSCAEGCSATFNGSAFTLNVGDRGWTVLFVDG